MGNIITNIKNKFDKKPIYTKENNPICILNITTKYKKLGSLKIELRRDIVPITVKNFINLCEGTRQNTESKYKNSIFHRIIPDFMAQGGDYENSNGTGRNSYFGGYFSDENFDLRHNKLGILSMANSGPNTNASQFFITFKKLPYLDGKHVVFGEVIEGFDILKIIESYGTKSGIPTEEIKIDSCYVIEMMNN